MKKESQVIFDRNVVEFVTVAAEFCKFLEQAEGMKRATFVDTSLKILPLLYLKASMMPKCEMMGEDMPENAFVWLAENSEDTRETVSATNEDIDSAYESLTSIDFGENNDATQIDTAVRNLYGSYSALYFLVTEPSGSRENFVLSLSGLIEDIESANDTLLRLLPAGK